MSEEGEVEALLAKISNDQRHADHPSRWRCEPVSLAVSLVLLLFVGFLVSMSMSTQPFWTFQELSGNWTVEAVGPSARRKWLAFDDMTNELAIKCVPPSEFESVVPESSDKLIGDLLAANCSFSFGPVSFDNDITLTTNRSPSGSFWSWTGRCSRTSTHSCIIILHKKRMLLTTIEGDDISHFVLMRSGRTDRGSWKAFWDSKGRFLVAIVVVVVVFKSFHIVLSRPSKEQRLAQIRRQRLMANAKAKISNRI